MKCELAEDVVVGDHKVSAKTPEGGANFVCFDEEGKESACSSPKEN